MLIHVQYSDNRYDMVREFWLDELLEKQKIIKFRRRDGWVTVGVDPVRIKQPVAEYQGPERRVVPTSFHYC